MNNSSIAKLAFNLFFIFSLSLFISCGETEITDENFSVIIDQENPPIITFEEEFHNFGTIIEGELVEHKFNFTNTGKGILVISSVNASCGCTVPRNWPKGPIKPGEGGYIEVVFDSKGRVGSANKVIKVTANTDPQLTKVALRGTVIGPDQLRE